MSVFFNLLFIIVNFIDFVSPIDKITYINGITKAIIAYDVDKALENIDNVLNEGKDIVNLIWEMIILKNFFNIHFNTSLLVKLSPLLYLFHKLKQVIHHF